MKGWTRTLVLAAIGAVLSGCDTPSPVVDAATQAEVKAGAPAEGESAAETETAPQVSQAQIRRFDRVRRKVGPAAGRVCTQQGDSGACAFRFRLDPRADVPAGALVTRTDDGAALVVATGTLLESTRSDDELAFVLAHMAGHHTEGHSRGSNQRAIAQTLISGAQGAVTGNIQSLVNTAIQLNSASGTRSFKPNEEIAADALATRITAEAGFDPVAGAAFFDRAPEGAELFLKIHRPDPARSATVRRVAAASQ